MEHDEIAAKRRKKPGAASRNQRNLTADFTDFTDMKELSSPSRQVAKTQRGQPQPKNLNRSTQRKQRRKNFAKTRNLSI